MQFITYLMQAVVERMLETLQIVLSEIGLFIFSWLLMVRLFRGGPGSRNSGQSVLLTLFLTFPAERRNEHRSERGPLLFSACLICLGLVFYLRLPASLYPASQGMVLFMGASFLLVEAGVRRFAPWQTSVDTWSAWFMGFGLSVLLLHFWMLGSANQFPLIFALSLYGGFALAYGVSLSKLLRKVAE